MLDTNICIYIMKQRDLDLFDKFVSHADKISISSIVAAELHFGIAGGTRKQESSNKLHEFLKPIKVRSFDYQAANFFGDLRLHLRRQGTPIGVMDTLIAAHALSLNATIITNHTREFDRVPNLKVENWVN